MATSPSGIDAGVLLDRDALAGQCALLDLQRRRQDDATVGRHAVTGIDHHDVAGHDLVGGNLHDDAVAAHLGHRLHHRAQMRGRRFGLALLVVAQPGVEQGQQREQDGGRVLTDQQADHRGDHEHDLHVVGVVLEEALERGSAFAAARAFGPYFCSLCCTSSAVRPRTGSTCSRSATSSEESWYHGAGAEAGREVTPDASFMVFSTGLVPLGRRRRGPTRRSCVGVVGTCSRTCQANLALRRSWRLSGEVVNTATRAAVDGGWCQESSRSSRPCTMSA